MFFFLCVKRLTLTLETGICLCSCGEMNENNVATKYFYCSDLQNSLHGKKALVTICDCIRFLSNKFHVFYPYAKSRR